ncbi:hypothetical protein LTR95_017034, partial [Oleoguttula sp. CCFEE 5521]
MLPHQVVLVGLLSLVTANPLGDRINSIRTLLQRDTFEWTALGDSYSSGVGSGDYTKDSYRCLRYDKAYPVLTDQDSRLPSGAHQFNNVVCSGSNTTEVELYQFYDEDTSGKPNRQYGTRPRFGSPSMATLSVGGNDIDFPGIIFNCMIDTTLPGSGGRRDCDAQKELTWKKLNDPQLIDKIEGTIKKILDRGRKGAIGDKFKLYVTGYPRFFSVETNECDSVTFARTANPKPDGKEHPMLTQRSRQDFNDMSVKLNEAIADAVSRHTNDGVKFIPIDDVLDGHRFCEPGHYPYNEPKDADLDDKLQAAHDKISAGVDILAAYPTFAEYENAVFEATQPDSDPDASGAFDFFWRRVGPRVKTFHPQTALHEVIRDKILDTYIGDLNGQMGAPAQDQNACHGVSGDYWIMSRDTAVDNVKDFCSQDSKIVTYNAGSVNELSLS